MLNEGLAMDFEGLGRAFTSYAERLRNGSVSRQSAERLADRGEEILLLTRDAQASERPG
jgi:hypothetical protein